VFGRQRKKQEGQQRHQYEVANKYVFKCRLKVDSDDNDVTNDGRLFHVRAAATGKARSPIVLRRVTGTTIAVDELERRLRLVPTSYHTVLKRQNRLKVGTDKPKLKVKMQSVSDDDVRKRLLEKPRFELAAKSVSL